MATYTIVHDLLAGLPDAVSGVAYFYAPGTTSPITIFGDDAGTATTNPAALDSNGAARVWLSRLARMIVQDVNGATIADVVINQDADATTANTSLAFSGTTQKAANDAALVAFGGQDYRYVPSGAWSGMTPRAWMNSAFANVMAYGSVGATQVNDGVTPADGAIAAAIADVQAQGGGVVYFPPGTYLCNSGIAFTATGITIAGASRGTTTIKMNASNSTAFTVTSANGTVIRDVRIASTATSTGTGVACVTSTGVTLHDVKIDGFYVSTSWTTCSEVLISGNANLNSPSAAAANGRCIKLTDTDNVRVIGISTGAFGASAFEYEFLGNGNNVVVNGCAFQATGVKFDSAFTGSGARFVGNYMGNLTTPFTFGAATIPLWFVNQGNGVDGYTGGLLTGATFTPNLALGTDIMIDATTTGSAYTVAVPAVAPNVLQRGFYMTLTFYAHAGGAITGWGVAAGYHLSSGPSTVDTHKTTYVLRWDGTVWRECSRADTT